MFTTKLLYTSFDSVGTCISIQSTLPNPFLLFQENPDRNCLGHKYSLDTHHEGMLLPANQGMRGETFSKHVKVHFH